MENFALKNCNCWDGVHTGIQKNILLLIRNGIIVDVIKNSDEKIPLDYRVIDLSNSYVMPGLINAHIHLALSGKPSKVVVGGKSQDRMVRFIKTPIGRRVLRAMMKKNVESELHSGVTTCRCVGDMHFLDIEFRQKIQTGKLQGPRLVVSGPIITPTGGHGQAFGDTADSPWEVRKLARRNIHHQVDLVKIAVTGGVIDARRIGEAGRPEMTLYEIEAACEEAHKAGLMVASHTESTEGMRLALLGGVDTIEHGAPLTDELVSLFLHNPKTLKGYSYLVPTLYPAIVIGELDSSLTLVTPIGIENSRIVYKGMVEGMKRALTEGITVGMGSDASCPFVTHYNFWRELDYAVRYAGLTTQQALMHATIKNAEILGIEDQTGTLQKGKAADLIVLEKNPLEDLRTLQNVQMVMAGKNFVEHPKVKVFPELEKILDLI